MLEARSANTAALAAALPRDVARADMRLQWVSRFLANPLVKPWEVMAPFAREAIENARESGEPLTVMIDQSKVGDGFETLMLALRFADRALPLLWLVKQTKGTIGFADQKPLLDALAGLIPDRAAVMLMGDRFYGTPALIDYCRAQGWGWRLRLKGWLTAYKDGEKLKLGELAQTAPVCLEDAEVTAKRVRTHIGLIHDKGCKNPWIVAMSDPPTYENTMDYAKRWGIECCFSDLKSRGFGLAQTQLQNADRIERLMLVMALALYYAVSCGLWDARVNPLPADKKTPRAPLDLAFPSSQEVCVS